MRVSHHVGASLSTVSGCGTYVATGEWMWRAVIDGSAGGCRGSTQRALGGDGAEG
jgi:hypothetical protein